MWMKIHFIGICGAGMSAVAKLAKDMGHEITGSDEGFYPPISDYLKDNNIPCSSPYKKENIPKDIEIVVIGKHAKLTPNENEEVKFAFDNKLKILSFPELLNQLTTDRNNIVIAGSYGKSTCTSLAAWILESSNVDAGYFIGAAPVTPESNAHVGTAREFVLEGDEYPSSNWDQTSKFLHYSAKDILITATAHDHVNVFPTHDSYQAPFIELIKTIDEGKVVICSDEISNQKIIEQFDASKFITYGLNSGTWQARNIIFGDITKFELTKNNQTVATLETSLLGKHNIQNIVGVSALLLEKDLISSTQLASAIKTFKGIKRRLDMITPGTKVVMYEGFGSSYDKARAAIEAILLHYPEKTLNIIFEPHTFSWRNRDAIHWYDDVFREAKNILIYEPPVHGATSHNQSSHDEIVSAVKKSNPNTIKINRETGYIEIEKLISDNAVFLVLSSGDMDGLLLEIKNNIKEKYKN